MCCSQVCRSEKRNLGAAAMLSGEEILCSTQQVIAGLEALRVENRSLLESLQEALENRAVPESSSVEQEKTSIIHQSLERIELGLSEAQVPPGNKEASSHNAILCHTSLSSSFFLRLKWKKITFPDNLKLNFLYFTY